MQDVRITWEDNKVTTESFKTEDEFFRYIRLMKDEEGIEVKDFETVSPNSDWAF